MNPFRDMMNDVVTLIKSNGTIINDIIANVQSDMIFIDDAKLPIEEGDKLIRELSNGLSETYLVIDRGFYEAWAGLDASYQVKVIKETTREPERPISNQYNIGTVYGSNIGTQGNASINNSFNFEKLDQLINENGGEDREELRQMVLEIKELFDDSEKVKKGSLTKYSEKFEKHSWITGAIAQMALGFLSGQIFK
jgi:hypothetical protein